MGEVIRIPYARLLDRPIAASRTQEALDEFAEQISRDPALGDEDLRELEEAIALRRRQLRAGDRPTPPRGGSAA